MSDQQILYAALGEKTGAELLNEKFTEKDSKQQLRFMMRVKKGQSTTMWLSVIDRLLELESMQGSDPAWSVDISKQYFRRPDLKFGWRIILQGTNLNQHYEVLAREVLDVRHSGPIHEIREVTLHGSPNRRSGGYTGTVPIGVPSTNSR